MKNIAVYTITSGLHDEAAVKHLSDAFLKGIFPDSDFDYEGSDFSSYGTHTLDLIYVRTGGAEGIFKSILPELPANKPFYLLTSGASNSLAASLEILSFLRQNGLQGEVLHGSNSYISGRIALLCSAAGALKTLSGMTLGVIGKPSDWLISSGVDYTVLERKLGIKAFDIPMEEMVETIGCADCGKKNSKDRESSFLSMVSENFAINGELFAKPEVEAKVKDALPGAEQIHQALRTIVAKYKLNALTLRCFDLLTSVGNTGCLALASMNAEGIPSSCEGDIPALLSMMISQTATGVTGFQANPARIDVNTGEMLFAHCTVPFNMVKDYCFDTHFESGIGVGIHGNLPEGAVTVFKVSGDLSRCFVAEGQLLRNQYEPNLCRTQVVLKLQPDDARYFLTDPIGNHHIIIPGHHAALLQHIVDAI